MKTATLPRAAIGHVVTAALHEIRDRVAADHRGRVADYIPELSRADPEWCALALVSLEGHPYHAGEAEQPFTLQSISKPFVYALALSDLGMESVMSRVGAEPSGEAFNAISLEPDTGRPANPMINAGAMIATSLVRADGPDGRFERILHCLSAFAGRPLSVDEAVFASEMDTGDRNRALAYLMRSAGSLRGSVDGCIEVYFRQCAVTVTTPDLAVMAATLANGGVNPMTGLRVVDDRIAGHVLSVMATCGMYDCSGEWLLRIGLPAKSGVSGGIIAVCPGQFGIGVFSPPLDRHGNSVRGTEVLRELSTRFDLHVMHDPGHAAPPVCLSTTVAATPSTRERSLAERKALAADGDRIAIVGAQGDLEFAAAEGLLFSIEQALPSHMPGAGWLVLDLQRVTRLHPAAAHLLAAHLTQLLAHDVAVTVVQPAERLRLPATGEFDERDDAVAWCEDALLARLS
jgi:glutaminase